MTKTPALRSIPFHGPNLGYILELYEKYQNDPDSVDTATQSLFQNWIPPIDAGQVSFDGRNAYVNGSGVQEIPYQKIVAVANLAEAIRRYGFLAARLDPLGTSPVGDPALELSHYGLSEADLLNLPCSLVGGPVVERSQNSFEAIQELRRIYSSSIGHDYAQVRAPAEREWFQQVTESRRFAPPADPVNPIALLNRLSEVEAFELFLHRIYPGKTRFSLEGLEMLVPVLDEIIGDAAADGVKSILIGMAHRGRLNVLAHVLKKPYREILTEFKDPLEQQALSARNDVGWTGDVNYHEGASRSLGDTGLYDAQPGKVHDVTVRMAPNPSHLELVNPVVEGMARADGTFSIGPGNPDFDHFRSLPVLIHGDAAFPGQGVVAETLNLARLDGYFTGGTIHIIANNQVGFTTDPHDTRSTLFASDLAKGFKIPIVHVNANDPVACMEVARMAAAYRNRFQRDFLINLIGYRRHGHNEGDEPRFTQPAMYKLVDSVPSVREIWTKQVVQQGNISQDEATNMVSGFTTTLQKAWDSLDDSYADIEPRDLKPLPTTVPEVDTSLAITQLRTLHESLLDFPADFRVNARIQRILRRRRNALDDPEAATIDWGLAEHLALAAILADGTAIRLTGEDVKRGTFSHRHAALYDAETGDEFIPLQNIPQSQAAFEIHNSPLTENATIGFEYGYNIQAPDRLVIWEAQYGDFINGAQPVIDEFLVSGRAKWEQNPSLVLLLPHGYEGQGPDHSSARPERFLQMAAEVNMRVVNCTTAAQYFHLLRMQAQLIKSHPLPLVVLTPKSLLRHPLAASTPNDLATGDWMPIIDDSEVEPNRVSQLILCNGKIYTDLVGSEQRTKSLKARKKATAVIRVELLYPFPKSDLQALLNRYPNLQSVRWVQEEPENMGAWDYIRPLLQGLLGNDIPLSYVGRPRRANPAEGSAAWHNFTQKEIINRAFKN